MEVSDLDEIYFCSLGSVYYLSFLKIENTSKIKNIDYYKWKLCNITLTITSYLKIK